MQEPLQSRRGLASKHSYNPYNSGELRVQRYGLVATLILLTYESYKEQVEKVSRLKEDTVRAILKNSQEIAMFKQEVSRHLQELRNFAEAE